MAPQVATKVSTARQHSHGSSVGQACTQESRSGAHMLLADWSTQTMSLHDLHDPAGCSLDANSVSHTAPAPPTSTGAPVSVCQWRSSTDGTGSDLPVTQQCGDTSTCAGCQLACRQCPGCYSYRCGGRGQKRAGILSCLAIDDRLASG